MSKNNTPARNIFATVFGASALERIAIETLFDQVSHGTVGASSLFARLMVGRGLPCLTVKGEPMTNPTKARWIATLQAIQPKGNGRETRATLPAFASAVLALMAGDRGPADGFDAAESAAWDAYGEALKAAKAAKAAAAAAAAAQSEAPAAAAAAAAAQSEAPAAAQSEAPATVQGEAPATVQGEAPATVQGEAPATVQGEAPATVQGEAPATPAAPAAPAAPRNAYDQALDLLEGAIRSHTLSVTHTARLQALIVMLQPASV